MESLYSRFLGIGFQNKERNRENNGLSRSSSMPFYLSFQARQLPNTLNGNIPLKKRKEGITSSDIKVQMLEEKIRNLENQQIQMVKSFNENNEINNQLLATQSNIMPVPLLILNHNDNNINNNNNYMPRSQVINNELQSSKLKFDQYRGLQRQDYTPNIRIYQNSNNPEYKSIFNRQKDYNTTKSKEDKYRLKNYLLEEEIKNNKLRNKARKFVNILDEEIYTPIEKDFHNYMNNVNKNIQQQLKEDNFILNEDIDKIENDFNDIKILLSQKLQNMENKQKENFEKLKNVIRKAGGRKMSKSIQNVFEGKNYDLQKAEEEYLANDIFNLPNIINKKMNEEELMNIEKEKRLRMQIEKKMNEEFLRKREIEELKHRERLKMLEIEREKERIENLKTLNMLRYQVRKENDDNYNNYINNMNNVNNMNPYDMAKNFSLNDISKIFFMKQMKKMNNNNGNIPFNMAIFNNMNTDEILKYMLFKNMGLDNNLDNTNNLYPENNFDYNMINNNNFDDYNNYNYNINAENNIINNNNNINENNNINNINEDNKSIIKENLNKNENKKSKFSTTNTKKEKNSHISKKIQSKSSKNESKKSKNNSLKRKEENKERKSTKRESKEETNNSKKSSENKKTNKEKKEEEKSKVIESSKTSSKVEEEKKKEDDSESSETSNKDEKEKKKEEEEDEDNDDEENEEDGEESDD